MNRIAYPRVRVGGSILLFTLPVVCFRRSDSVPDDQRQTAVDRMQSDNSIHDGMVRVARRSGDGAGARKAGTLMFFAAMKFALRKTSNLGRPKIFCANDRPPLGQRDENSSVRVERVRQRPMLAQSAETTCGKVSVRSERPNGRRSQQKSRPTVLKKGGSDASF